MLLRRLTSGIFIKSVSRHAESTATKFDFTWIKKMDRKGILWAIKLIIKYIETRHKNKFQIETVILENLVKSAS